MPQSDALTPDRSTIHPPIPDPNPGLVIIGGLTTLAAVMLAFGAIDDITTDNAPTFAIEYTLLIISACWSLFVAIRLLVDGKRLLGTVSLLVLVGAVWGPRAIGPGTVPATNTWHIVVAVSLLWYFVLSIVLLVVGFRRLRMQ